MPGKTQEVRTIMYSVEANGNVVVHKFPFNGNDKYGIQKLQRLVDRGFTFADPREDGGLNIPQVIVTKSVDLDKPVLVQHGEQEMAIAEVSGGDGIGEKPVRFDELTIHGEPSLQAEPSVRGRTINKKWRNMNAQERKAYQEAKKGG